MSASGLLASVIIPAHNEAVVIERCLRAFGEAASELEIVVVCNGCTDDTAKRAMAFDGVHVIEIPAASKVAALNAGDSIASVMPRVYLDADVQLDASAMRAVVQALSEGAPSAAPVPVMDTSKSSLSVRAYFAVWQQLGYTKKNALGSGVYGMSKSGRSRFESFPDLISDDGFVYSLFTISERINPPDATFIIQAPRTLRALFRRRIRITQGAKELVRAGWQGDVPGPFWYDVLRQRPQLLMVAPVFGIVNVLAKVAAERRIKAGDSAWNRDDSRGAASMKTRPLGIRRATRTLGRVSTYKNFARLVNFFGYDVADQNKMQTGAGVRVAPTVSVRNGERISIGAGARIGQNCYLWAGDNTGRIIIGDFALFAPDVMLTASNYDFDAGPGPVMDLPKREADIVIGANTWLGAKVMVVAGVTIGDGTIVAAGSVVTKSLPPNVVAGGVPARVLRFRENNE